MTTVRKRPGHELADGVYRAIVASIEPGITSRFSAREDLVRIGLDLVDEIDGQRPRVWLVASPMLQGRLQALVEGALGRTLTADEAGGFELEEIQNKEVNVVIAAMRGESGFSYSRIITFLPIERSNHESAELSTDQDT